MVNNNMIKFEGIFNVYGQRIVEYTWAVHRDKAFQNFIHKIAKKYNIPIYQMRSMYNGDRDNYSVTEVN